MPRAHPHLAVCSSAFGDAWLTLWPPIIACNGLRGGWNPNWGRPHCGEGRRGWGGCEATQNGKRRASSGSCCAVLLQRQLKSRE